MKTEKLKPVAPCFPYPGGKSKMRSRLIALFPPHKTYCEPFAGGLAVLLAHDSPFPREIVNDKDAELISFYKNVARHPAAVTEALSGFLASRADFKKIINTKPATELDRAARWFYLTQQSFGAQRKTFGRAQGSFNGVNLLKSSVAFHALARRFSKTIFRTGDAVDVIREFDSPSSFFFVDPPYVDCGKNAYSPFSEKEMKTLRDVVLKAKGMWLLTCDDSEATRRVFAGLPARENKIIYTLSKEKTGAVSGELMIFSKRLASMFRGDVHALQSPTRGSNEVFFEGFLNSIPFTRGRIADESLASG